jgi:hypothetical protein
MAGPDPLDRREIGHGARDLENAIIRACGEGELCHRFLQQIPGRRMDAAVLADIAVRHTRVRSDFHDNLRGGDLPKMAQPNRARAETPCAENVVAARGIKRERDGVQAGAAETITTVPGCNEATAARMSGTSRRRSVS